MDDMNKIPEHIRAALRQLIAEGLPVDQIAFMMRLSREAVEEEVRRVNTTKEEASPRPRVKAGVSS
jgi:DNA-directed RNA polymerase specialized sigma24 family protein